LCDVLFQHPAEFIDAIIYGVEAMKAKREGLPIPQDAALQAAKERVAAEAVKAGPLGGQGRPTKEEQANKGYGVTFIEGKSKRGNRAKYRTARIARDAPEVLERMKAGEFASVAAAERAAGLKGVTDRRVWLSANPEEAARKLLRRLPAAYLMVFVRALHAQLAAQQEGADAA
jgi:hypothetical protein